MAKKDRLTDRLSKIQVHRNNSRDDKSNENDSRTTIVVLDSADSEINSNTISHTENSDAKQAVEQQALPKAETQNETSQPQAKSAEDRSALQEAREAIRRQREEDQAQKLLQKEEARRKKRQQKKQRAEARKEIQEQKRAEREHNRQAAEAARKQKEQEEQKRREAIEKEKARLKAEQEQREAQEKALKEQQETLERAEKQKRDELRKLELQKQAEIEAAQAAERQKQIEVEKVEKARLEEVEKLEKQKQLEADKLAKQEKAKQRAKEKAERGEAARHQREEKKRQAAIAKQKKKEQSKVEKREKETENTSKILIPQNRSVDITDEKPAKTPPINRVSEIIQKRKAARANRKMNREGIDSGFHIFNKGSKAYVISGKIKSFFKNITLKKLLVTFSLLFIFVVAINRLPSLLYNWISDDKNDEKTVSFTVDTNFGDAVEKSVYDHKDEDFDGDLILNGMDEHPFDFDNDKNGIKDSDTSSTFALNSALKVGNVVYEPKDSQSGVSHFLNYYVFTNCKEQWIKVKNTNQTPYAYYDERWHEVEYEQKGENLYIYIPTDYCYISLIDFKMSETTRVKVFGKELTNYSTENFGGKVLNVIFTVLYPYESDCPFDIGSRSKNIEYFERKSVKRDHTSGLNVTKINTSNLSRFSQMPIDGDDMNIIYHGIEEGNTSLISLQSDKGEILLIAYGYDYLGNLYVADYFDNEKTGKINVRHEGKVIRTANGSYKTYTQISFSGCGVDFDNYKVVLIK